MIKYIYTSCMILQLLVTSLFAAGLGGTKDDQGKPLSDTQYERRIASLIDNRITVSSPQTASIAPKAGEQINWQVISGGGTKGNDGIYYLSGTLGQTAVGMGNDGSDYLHHGYWQSFGSGSYTCCIPPSVGDLDQSGQILPYNVDGIDLSMMIDMLFISLEPVDCLDEADVDFNCNAPLSARPCSDPYAVDGIDLSWMIDALFISLNPLSQCDGTPN